MTGVLPSRLSSPLLALGCGVLLLAGVWTAIVRRAEGYEQEAAAVASQNLANLNLAFEEGLSRSIKAVDQAMIAMRALYMRRGQDAEFTDLARILARTDPAVVGFGVADTEGHLVFASGSQVGQPEPGGPGWFNIAGSPYFQVHVPPGADELFIGQSAVGRITGRWSVFLSRGIETPGGQFGGVMIALADAAALGDFYKKIDIGLDGVVTVIGTDGFVRVRVGAKTGVRFGDDLRAAPVFQAAMSGRTGVSRVVSVVDRTDRLIAYRKLEGLPLIVTVAAGMDGILRETHDRAASLYFAGGAISLSAGLIVVIVWIRSRRALEQARQSALLRAVFDNMGEGILVLDAEARVAAWNGRLGAMIGVDPQVLRPGVPLRTVILSRARAGECGDADPLAEAERRLAAFTASPGDVREWVRPGGGTIQLRRRPLPDGGSLTVCLDITEIKQAERALREMNASLEKIVAGRTAELQASERRLSRAQEVAKVGHWVHAAGAMTWSPAAAALFGATPDDLAVTEPAYIQQFVHPDDQVRIAAAKRLSPASQGTVLQYRIVRPDGTVRHMTETIDSIGAGTPENNVETIGTIHDISDRVEAERELAAARTNLSDAIESLDHTIVLYDPDDRIILFNQKFGDRYDRIRDVLRPETLFAEAFRAAVERGVVVTPAGMSQDDFVADAVDAHRRANGTRFLSRGTDGRTFEVWENRSRNGGIIAIGADVTERLKVEEQLRQAQRMEAIGQLTGGIAHDFNNLLAILTIDLEALAPLVSHDPAGSRLIAESLAAAASGAGLTQRLLAFARRQTLAPETVSVSTLIGRMAPLIRRAISEKVTLSLELAAGTWPTFIDPAQLEASVLNLAANARDAMPEGGLLTITAGNRHIEAHQVPDLAPGDYVTITVQDTGTGMTPEVRNRIFEPFFTTKETGRGTGLGLSMVFGFLTQSRGGIAVESTVGQGTSFHLYLPRAPDRPAVPVVAAPEPAAMGGGEVVLAVEDNALLRVSVVRQLHGLGYTVLEASDALAALAVLAAQPVALVLSDVLMPGPMDGMGLAREIQARWPEVKVVLTSGYTESWLTGLGGTVRFLPKPVRRESLARAIRETLDAV